MTKRNCFSFFVAIVLSLFSVSAFAQNVQVSGKVTESGEPLAGASVLVQGTTVGVITDLDGNYTISAPKGSVLEYGFIGYVTEYRNVEADAVIDIEMQVDSELLNETIVVGYGATTKKKDLSASVGIVQNMEQLTTRPVSTTEGMLQGQVAGVVISSAGGAPDSTPSVVIRGQGSRNGDSVLWVVDGIPGAPIPSNNDIESIVVLKDAASAAIYGAQSGAGGIILVTTKQAKNPGVSVEYDGIFGIRQATNLIQPLNAQQEIEMRKISYKNAGMNLPDGWDVSKNPWIGTQRTNWMDEIFRTAFYNRHNVVLNAATEKFKSRLSFNVDDDNGVLKNTYRKNYGIHYTGSYQINDWIKISEDLTWKQSDSRGTSTHNPEYGTILSAIYMPGSAETYHDGKFGGTTTEDPEYLAKYGSFYADAHGDSVNPLRNLLAGTQFNRNNRLWSTTSLEVANIVKGLKFNSRFTYALANGFYKYFEPKRTEIGKPNLKNTLDYSTSRYDEWKTENTLTYDRTFGKHTVGALLSTTANHYVGRGFSAQGTEFADESQSLQYFSFAGNKTADDWYSGADANVGIISRVAYSYDDRYFMTASWRRDYAGRLPKESNYGDFPAVTGAWKISNEKFFPKTDVVNLVKLRASWGRIGNLGSIGYNYKSSLLDHKTWNSQGAIFGTEAGVMMGSFWWAGTALNKALTWETSQQADFGLDIDMFKERLNISVDYYDKKTYNLIQDQTTGWPVTIGVDPMQVNQGEIRNRGIELTLGWNDRKGDWTYYVNGNFSYNKNWVASTGIVDDDGNPGVWTGGGSYRNIPWIYQDAVGQPLGSYYMIRTDGIFQSDAEAAAYTKDGNRIQPNAQAGDLKFVDKNNDGKINDEDRDYLGSATPKYTFALNAGFTWKKFSASMMLQGVGGNKIAYLGKYSIYSDVDGNFNRAAGILDAWSPTNTGSNLPRISKLDNNGNFTTASDWYLEDGSYLRIKNITIGYDLTDIIRKVPHFAGRNSSMSVYFSGENLFTFTKYSGMDPECGGEDKLRYPVSRVLTLGIKLTY